MFRGSFGIFASFRIFQLFIPRRFAEHVILRKPVLGNTGHNFAGVLGGGDNLNNEITRDKNLIKKVWGQNTT